MSDTDWTALAAVILAEVNLTFDDVYDLGRDWVIGRGPFAAEVAPPAHRGVCHPPAWDNPTARQRYLIGLTGPVDDEKMLNILAHECGHIKCGAWTSEPAYVHEYRAETYAHEALRRHLGREPDPQIVADGKAYVREFCEHRFGEMGPSPTKGWLREPVAWCGFIPPEPLRYWR